MYAAQLVNTAYRCMVTMHAANVPAQLQTLFDQLNTEVRQHAQGGARAGQGRSRPASG